MGLSLMEPPEGLRFPPTFGGSFVFSSSNTLEDSEEEPLELSSLEPSSLELSAPEEPEVEGSSEYEPPDDEPEEGLEEGLDDPSEDSSSDDDLSEEEPSLEGFWLSESDDEALLPVSYSIAERPQADRQTTKSNDRIKARSLVFEEKTFLNILGPPFN